MTPGITILGVIFLVAKDGRTVTNSQAQHASKKIKRNGN